MTEPTAPTAAPRRTVKVPGVGAVDRRYVYVGVGVVAVIVGVAYWRRRRAAQTVAIDTTTGTVGGSSDYVNPNPNASGSDTEGDPSVILSDSQWVQAVLSDFATSDTFDRGYAQIVLGKYLGGQPLDSDEQNLVRAAWALEGHPPSNTPIIPLTSGGGSPGQPGPGPSGPQFVSVQKGERSDAWVNAMTHAFGLYYGDLVALNPGLPGNISKDKDPAKRVFIEPATYRVR